MDIRQQPVAIEGAFVLVPPSRARQKLPVVPLDMAPTLGVSVALQKDNVSQVQHFCSCKFNMSKSRGIGNINTKLQYY